MSTSVNNNYKWVSIMNSAIKTLEKAGSWIAGAVLMVIMLLVGTDAVARYALGSPIPWSMELVSYYLMVVVAYMAAADTFRHGDHIQLDLFLSRMSPRTKAWTGFAHATLGAMVFAIIAYASACSMVEAYLHHEFIHGYTAWPVWPSYLPIALGCALLAIRLVHHAVMLISHGEDPAIELQEDI